MFDARGGLKYQFVVRPGGDPSEIQMKWNKECALSLDAEGNALITSVVDTFTDHAPSSWMDGTIRIPVTSSFALNGNILSFNVGQYDNNKTLVIDPWTINPGFTTFNDAFDIEPDFAGNIYIYGGSAPYTLKKFTNLGVLIWTYTNVVSSWYYGDFTIDAAGNPFLVYGPWGDQCVQLSPGGVMNYNTNSGVGGSRETYRVECNPITGMMDVMGMEIVSGLNPMALQINPAGGTYAPATLNPTSTSGEFRAMCIDGTNGDIFGMTWAGSGSTNPVDNLIWKLNSAYVNQWSIQDGYNLNEIDASSTDSDFSGYNGMAVGCFLFSYDGVNLKKWDKATGALIAQVNVTSNTQYTVGGVATDACGNVYVGTANSVRQYDSGLNLINTVATTGMVFDVQLGINAGEVLACGSGFAQSMTFPVGACAPTTSITSTPSTGCPCDGSATVAAQVACVSGSFTYSWSPMGGTGSTASNLCPGTYTVIITDIINNIIDTQTVVVTGATVAITATISGVNPTCPNAMDGSATATPTGGTAPYTYLWSPGNQTTQTITGLGPGTYTVFIWDADSCSTQQTITLTAPPPFTVASLPVAPIMCFGDCNGSVIANPVGTGPFTYSWNTSPIQTTQTATGLCDGTYIVTVSDINNCTSLDTITITEPTALTLTAGAPASVCSGACANISITPAGGTPAYSYLWMPGAQTTAAITVCPTATTTYTVLVTDANGCQRIDSVQVTILPPPVPVFTVDQQTGCELHCVNFTNQTPGSGTITWIYGDNNQGSSPIHCYSAGTYDVSLIVVGTNGCIDTVTYVGYITSFPNPIASFVVDNDYVSLWEPDVCATDQSTNAYSWLYDFADPNNPGFDSTQNPCHMYGDTGTYCIELRVTSVDGCVDSTVVCIEVYEETGMVYIPNTFTPNANGLNDYFLPVGTGINPNEYHFMIFDRWGMLIWETHTWGEGWNGVPRGASQIAQIDTYVWKISCKDDLGNNIARIGHVNLIK